MDAEAFGMKVLQVASSLSDWGGIERYVLYLSRGLTERGHDVTVAAPANTPLEKHLRAEGKTVETISVVKKFDFDAFRRYLALFRGQKFDVVHGHFSPDFVVAGVAARLRRVPVSVMTRHVALPWAKAKANVYLKLWKGIIPVSNAVKQKLSDSGVPESRMCVAKAGTPRLIATKGREEMRAELGLRVGSFAAGSFSRLVKEKGIDIFLRSIPWAPDVQAVIYGEGPAGEELAQLSSFLKVANQVSFMGRVTDIANHMSAMDVVVIPSVWDEAFPYAALEALSLGVPVVASEIGGLPEIVVPNENGFLFTKGSPQDLGRALNDARSDDDRRARLAKNGKALQEAEYTVEKMAERIEGAYRQFGA